MVIGIRAMPPPGINRQVKRVNCVFLGIGQGYESPGGHPPIYRFSRFGLPVNFTSQ